LNEWLLLDEFIGGKPQRLCRHLLALIDHVLHLYQQLVIDYLLAPQLQLSFEEGANVALDCNKVIYHKLEGIQCGHDRNFVLLLQSLE
jgi:hypothetical protein